MNLPDWMAKLTLFGHIPQIPVDEVSGIVIVVLIAIAGVLNVTGVIGLNLL